MLGVEDVARVFSMVSFDREKQKQYLVPIVIRDAGHPVCSSTSTLTVVVGDVNDNLMQSGSMDVLAYVYRVSLNSNTLIGPATILNNIWTHIVFIICV